VKCEVQVQVQVQKQKQKQKQNAGVLRCAQNDKQRGSNGDGVVAGLVLEIPTHPHPIEQAQRGPRFANCAMDGAPVLLWLVVENGQRQMRVPFRFGKLSLLTLS
jgi:hypothetical protein